MVEFLKWILGLRDDNGRDLNLVQMILGLASNHGNDYKKLEDVYEIYEKMEEMKYNENFRNSLKNSKKYIQDKNFKLLAFEQIKELQIDDPNSFLLFPLKSAHHMWSTLIKKTEEGYSALIVNKGMRFWHDPVEEFVFKEGHLEKLMECLSYAGKNEHENIEDIYRMFLKKSDAQYNLKILLASQKTGNCFTKNIQAGIKLAQGIRNMSKDEFNKLRSKDYSPFGTFSKEKRTFKWEGLTTEEAHFLFAYKIAVKNPHISKEVSEALDVYTSNKLFKEKMKTSSEGVKILFSTFDPQDNTKDMSQEERIKLLLKKLNHSNFMLYQEDIEDMVKSTKDQSYIGLFRALKLFEEMGAEVNRNNFFTSFLEANHSPVSALITVFDPLNKLKDMEDNKRSKELLRKLDYYCLKTNQSHIEKMLQNVYAKDSIDREFEELLKNAEVENIVFYEKLNDLKDIMRQLRRNFPLIVKDVQDDFLSSRGEKNKEIQIKTKNNTSGFEMA